MLHPRASLILTFALLTCLPGSADAAPIVTPKPSWSGLVSKDSAGLLPNQLHNREDQSGLKFAMGVGQQAKDFDKFVRANANDRGKVAMLAWLKDVNWEKEVVCYAVLELHTNRLRYKSFGVDKSGTTVVQVVWSGIEPFYRGSYPAVFVRIPNTDVNRVVMSINFGVSTLNTVIQGNGVKKAEPVVRSLKINRKGLRPRIGRPGATSFATLDDLDKALGEKLALQVKKQVNFTKEDVVVVNWTSGGPPFGTLKHEMKKTRTGSEVVFYVQGPKFPPGKPAVRGRALKLGFDLFAVPKKTKVKLAPGERQ